MTGNEFYDLVTMKMKCNKKYKLSVSLLENTNYWNCQENQQKILLTYTQIVSKYSQENHKVLNQ